MAEIRDVVIVGSGPAGYTAAIYAGRAELKPLIFTGLSSGGQLMNTTEIENFPGFSQGIMGPKLMMEMRSQAQRFGTEIIDDVVERVDFSKKPLTVVSGGKEYMAKTVILATGAEAMKLGVKGESDYIGRGVSYCAVCDAAFYRDKKVVVVGGGDAAMEDALALTKFASSITIIHRRDDFKASKIMKERVLNNDKITVKWNTAVLEVMGDGKKISSIKTTEGIMDVEGLFVAIGHKPATMFLKDCGVVLDERGYIKTKVVDGDGWGSDYPTRTNIPGVFAAGDSVDFKYRQAVVAAGMGTMAALDAERYLVEASL